MTDTSTVLQDKDSVFPGENWFFYWKTSSSLWRTKLSEFKGKGKILVPINWSFHSDTGDKIDFAEVRPETDFKKLVEIAREVGREIVFLLPLTPCPFLPNGGIPHLLARSLSISTEGLVQCGLDADGNLHKLYSFFDTRVFQAFSRFCYALGQYFSESGIDADVFGLNSGYMQDDAFCSFFSDRSKTYEQAFSRFLSAQREQNQSMENIIKSPEEEARLRSDFQETIYGLYRDVATQKISANWEGVIEVAYLGASTEDFFNRINDVEILEKYTFDSLESLTRNVMPASVMVPSRVKHGLLEKLTKEEVTDSFASFLMEKHWIEEEEGANFKPLRFFELYLSDFNGTGFKDFLFTHLPWSFALRQGKSYQWDESDIEGRIFYFDGVQVDLKLYHNILKIFMSGGKVLLNKENMDFSLAQKLETFQLENQLQVEKVNFHTEVSNISLGEGRMVLFNGEKLEKAKHEDQMDFWGQVLSTFEIRHLFCQFPDGIYSFWKTRDSNHQELNYEEIRRLSLYNPTSYKKKFKIPVPKNFNVVRVHREDGAKIQTHPKEVEIEMVPSGVVVIDFGVFS